MEDTFNTTWYGYGHAFKGYKIIKSQKHTMYEYYCNGLLQEEIKYLDDRVRDVKKR
jgi:hypothetical protein